MTLAIYNAAFELRDFFLDLNRVFARFQQSCTRRSIAADILEWHRFLKSNALLSSADKTV